MSEFKDLDAFNESITGLLTEEGQKVLTGNAKNLTVGDLVAMGWKQHTKSSETLGLRDLNSIEEAFSSHPLHGSSTSELVGAACCCTCTPACCCTAAAVVEAA